MNNKNIDEVINDIDIKIKELETKELEGKSHEEKEYIKEKWDNERKKIKEEFQNKYQKFEVNIEHNNQSQTELQCIDDMKRDVAEFKQQIEDDFQKTMEEVNPILNEQNNE